jgi:protein arginine N-methyltransferase 1
MFIKMLSSLKKKIVDYDDANADMFSNIQEHERMLADSVRVSTYHEGLTKHIKEGDTVIDLGTGTGLLSFLAAKKKPKRIYALDHSNIMDIAKLVANKNNIDCIEFINMNSRNFTLNEKVDVIIHEQIGDFLFEENMIKNICDLRDRLLKPGGIILPSKFDFYIEPIMLSDEYSIPYLWDQKDICGINFSCTKDICSNLLDKSHNYFGINNGSVEKMLSTNEPAYSFDLENIVENDLPTNLIISRTVKEDGRMDGFAVYFKTNFDDEISFTTYPLGKNTNWAGRMLRISPKEVKRGEKINLDIKFPDIRDQDSWFWNLT